MNGKVKLTGDIVPFQLGQEINVKIGKKKLWKGRIIEIVTNFDEQNVEIRLNCKKRLK